MDAIMVLLLILVPGLPLAWALALVCRSWRSVFLRLAPWTVLPGMLAAMPFADGTVLQVPWLLLGARLGLDPVGRVFLGVSAFSWLVAGIYAQRSLAMDPRRSRFFFFYLLTASGNLGIIVVQDLASFYLFFTLMSLAFYALIIHDGTPGARRAGRVYISLAIIGEALLYAGFTLLARRAGTLDLPAVAVPAGEAAFALLFLGFGIKAGSLPLHVWMPLVYRHAPIAAAVVSSGALINAGLLGWLRFLPLGQEAQPELGLLYLTAGLAAAFYGVMVGLTQTEPKSLLAYSSISQMGLMTVPVGIGLAAPAAWPLALAAVLVYVVHHALAKGALFLGVGLAAANGGPDRRRLLSVGLLLPALALAGMPLTSGAIAKLALKQAAAAWPVSWIGWLELLLSLTAVGTTLLMVRFLFLFRAHPSGRTNLEKGLSMPWGISLAAVAAAPVLWPSLAVASLDPAKLWSAFWPVGLGALIGGGAAALAGRTGTRMPVRIPAGDILLPVERGGRSLVAAWAALAERRPASFWPRALPAGLAGHDRWLRLEARLRQWFVAGLLFLAITAALLLALPDP
ncbi:complex I subunit 5 family protein [Thermithiobacillus tepidarius DSM 3134]|uniref:complex I subunit 5 family protein n=1 Tax=Thermithiobacillus tepidarius TaxID=929 RepID=UPI00056E1708|nr:complex I subunit 5 family protein [Thermithiobacillus tepidarius]